MSEDLARLYRDTFKKSKLVFSVKDFLEAIKDGEHLIWFDEYPLTLKQKSIMERISLIDLLIQTYQRQIVMLENMKLKLYLAGKLFKEETSK